MVVREREVPTRVGDILLFDCAEEKRIIFQTFTGVGNTCQFGISQTQESGVDSIADPGGRRNNSDHLVLHCAGLQ
jgi:hypothetical protein